MTEQEFKALLERIDTLTDTVAEVRDKQDEILDRQDQLAEGLSNLSLSNDGFSIERYPTDDEE